MSRIPSPLPTLAAVAFSALAAILTGAALVTAHGNPEITISPSPATAGGTVTIEGTDFEEEEEVSLLLEGITGEIALGMAMTDAEGNFRVEVTLPDGAKPGSYRIKAKSSDATAITEFRIAAHVAEPGTEHPSIGFHAGGPAEEVIGLGVVLAALAVLGLGLLVWRERQAT